MVNQRLHTLPRPIRWFSLPRCCRAERPQRGRLREFFQWNIDIIGSDSLLADAECIFTAVDYLRSVGLTAEDVVVRISSRALLAALLAEQGFDEKHIALAYTLLDKRPKLPAETFEALVREQLPDASLQQALHRLDGITTLADLDTLCRTPDSTRATAELRELFDHLEALGIAEYCTFDIRIVRGLAYYTGPVFEIFDRRDRLRAIAAGGRYDDLLAGLGGPQVSGTGFGMGDVVLGLLLQEKGLLRPAAPALDFYLLTTDARLLKSCLTLTGTLRHRGFATAFSYKPAALGKQLKAAAAAGARYAVILGTETLDRREVSVKNLTTGKQVTIPWDTFLARPDGQV